MHFTKSKKSRFFPIVVRIFCALAVTILLVAFLLLTRLLDSKDLPDQTIRPIETVDAVAAPAPPPPPPPIDETPPPPPPPLPQLEVQLNNVAPPVKAAINQNIDYTIVTPKFILELDVPPPLTPKPSPNPTPRPSPVAPKPIPQVVAKSSYTLGELDAKPRLLNNPSVSFPTSLRRRGVRQGTVTLNISIDTSGKVAVNDVISSSHPELISMAKSYATRARYTVPKKNGQAVKTNFIWPLTLKP